VNTDLLVTGFCVTFGERCADGRPAEVREDYEAFPECAVPLPLWIDHAPVWSFGAFHDAGRVIAFSLVDGLAPIPDGLLALCQLHNTDVGRGVLRAVEAGELWAMSRGGDDHWEISLTSRPALQNCRIVGWGPAALSAWDLLVPGVPV
jgi:hypothetical protein